MKTRRFALLMPRAILLATLLLASTSHAVANALNELDSVAFPPSVDNEGIKTDALLVMKDGAITYQRYANGYHRDMPHIAWSISKSLTSLILGTAVKEGRVRLDESVCEIQPALVSLANCEIKMDHLLSWTSGLDVLEVYEGSTDRTASTVGQMLLGDGHKNIVSFHFGHRQRFTPGTHIYYSTGDSAMVIGILKGRYSAAEYADLPFRTLFRPLNASSAVFETDSSGHFMGGSGVFLSAYDLLKMGQLVLDDGVWKGTRLLPEGWIQFVTSPTEGERGVNVDGSYIPARSWWRPKLDEMGLAGDPNFPEDIVMARGHWGQYLIIIPSLKLVAVRLGQDQNRQLAMPAFLRALVEYGRTK